MSLYFKSVKVTDLWPGCHWLLYRSQKLVGLLAPTLEGTWNLLAYTSSFCHQSSLYLRFIFMSPSQTPTLLDCIVPMRTLRQWDPPPVAGCMVTDRDLGRKGCKFKAEILRRNFLGTHMHTLTHTIESQWSLYSYWAHKSTGTRVFMHLGECFQFNQEVNRAPSLGAQARPPWSTGGAVSPGL